ncbi:hypothetical protein K2Q16_00775, partial [Patescibacteria group bacterium]|nr:hypothetical protein [Patescibacteria group bacterium]
MIRSFQTKGLLALSALALTAAVGLANPASATCVGGSMCGNNGQMTRTIEVETGGWANRDGGNFQGAAAAGNHTRTRSWGSQEGVTGSLSGAALGTATNGCPGNVCGSTVGLMGSAAGAMQTEMGGSSAMAR